VNYVQGYDQLCCMAGEAENPKRNIPLATLFTLTGVAVIYMLATLVLTGMIPSEQISVVSGFPSAFFDLKLDIAAQITALGEIATLPIVVLITTMVQPRLLYAMAQDGLLPGWFACIDDKGNLWNGTLFGGTIMTLVATFVPFAHLNDIISCAALSALSMTDTSLLFCWYDAPSHSPLSSASALQGHPHRHRETISFEKLILIFHVSAFGTSMVLTHLNAAPMGHIAAIVGTGCMLVSVAAIWILCPLSAVFGGGSHHSHSDDDGGYFRTPFLPLLPCFAIFTNYYLIAQLEIIGILGFLGIVGLASAFYVRFKTRRTAKALLLGDRDDSSCGSDEDRESSSTSSSGAREQELPSTSLSHSLSINSSHSGESTGHR